MLIYINLSFDFLNLDNVDFENYFANKLINIGRFAYQENKSCVQSSFVLQEIIHANVEKGSKVFCCFLDSTKAFDSVWFDGLFFKLFNIRMKGKSWGGSAKMVPKHGELCILERKVLTHVSS